MNSCIYLFAAV